jgi:hypothetical protein
VNESRLKEILKFSWPEIEKRGLAEALKQIAQATPDYLIPLVVKKQNWQEDLVESVFIDFSRFQTQSQIMGGFKFLNPTFQVFKIDKSKQIQGKSGVFGFWNFNNQFYEEPISLEQAMVIDLLKDSDTAFWAGMIAQLPANHQNIINQLVAKGIISLN